MSVKKFKFVSPGIFLNEIDNSQLPKAPEEMGPVVIGRADRGPGLVPTKVDSFSEFVETFGMPVPGGKGGDVWREGNKLGPTYGVYAAQAYLRNSGPLTYVRLLGADHDDYATSATRAGWKVSGTLSASVESNAAAYGLFVADHTAATPASSSVTVAGYAARTDHAAANGVVDSKLAFAADGSTPSLTWREGTSLNGTIILADTTSTWVGGTMYLSSSAGVDTVTLNGSSWSATEIVDEVNASCSHFVAVLGDGATTGTSTALMASTAAWNATPLTLTDVAADLLADTSVAEADQVWIFRDGSTVSGGVDPDTPAIYFSGAEGDNFYIYTVNDRTSSTTGALTWTQTACTAATSDSAKISGIPATAAAASQYLWYEGDSAAASVSAVGDALAAAIASGSAAANDSSAQLLAATNVAGTITVQNRVIAGVHGNTSTWSTADCLDAVTVTTFAGGANGSGAASGSAEDLGDAHLAAVVYCDEGALSLVGSDLAGVTRDGGSMWIQSDGSDYEFKLRVRDDAGTTSDTISFNMSPSSKKYVRKVLNTNPTLCNNTITSTSQLKTYWLGESFDQYLAYSLSATTAAGSQMACLVPLKQKATSGADQSDNRVSARPAQSGWVVSQHLGSGSLFTADSSGEYPVLKLMKFHGLYSGEWEQQNLKISIEDIKASTNEFEPYGSFSVVVRRANDKDNSPRVVERFSSCNLNPNSANYIARKIGDMYSTWNYSEGRFITYGRFNNQSGYFRVEMNSDVDTGVTDPSLLPFGYYGKARWKTVTVGTDGDGISISTAVDAASGVAHVSGSSSLTDEPLLYAQSYAYRWGDAAGLALGATDESVWMSGSADIAAWTARQPEIYAGNLPGSHIDLHYPNYQLRVSSSQGDVSNPKDAYWGLMTSKEGSSRHDPSYEDLGRPWATTNEVGTGAWSVTADNTEYGEFFTLDDLRMATDGVSTSTTHASWAIGNRSSGVSLTAVSGTYNQVLSQGFDRFTMPVWGGADGLDIMEQEPFRNTALSGQSALTHYAYNSIKRAVDSVADPEVVECNLMAMPGITNTGLTEHMINTCENRADALAVIDLQNDMFLLPRELQLKPIVCQVYHRRLAVYKIAA